MPCSQSSQSLSGLSQVVISTIVRRLSQASGSSNPSAIRVNTSAFFPNATVPPFFPPYVDLPIPEALLASQFGALIQESIATLIQGSFAIDVDVLCVSPLFCSHVVRKCQRSPPQHERETAAIAASHFFVSRHNVSSSYGRWPSTLGNVVLMNSNTFLFAVKRAMDRLPLINILNLALTQQQQANSSDPSAPPPPAPTPLAAALVSTDETPLTDPLLGLNLQDYAFVVYVRFKNREQIYSSSFK